MGFLDFLSSGFDYVVDGISGLFDSDGADEVVKVATNLADKPAEPKQDGDSFFGSLGSALLSKEGIAGLLGAGNSYLTSSMQNDFQEQQYERQREADKFKALLDFEKLKYSMANKGGSGGSGGGSGGASQNRATLINALASAKSGQSNALGNLSQTLGGIYGR